MSPHGFRPVGFFVSDCSPSSDPSTKLKGLGHRQSRKIDQLIDPRL